jgi:23S rRNA (adenine1618-N6)-methyltransferase
MIEESVLFQNQVDWFTCLVSKKDNVKKLIDVIEKCDAKEHKIVQMAQGAKASRFIAWRFN